HPRPAADRGAGPGPAHQLWGVPRAAPAGSRGPDPRADVLVVRARGGAVEVQLRMEHGPRGVEPGVAQAAAGDARLAAGPARPRLRRTGRPGPAGPLDGPGRLHRRHPGPQPRAPPGVLRRLGPPRGRCRGPPAGAPPPRDAAARPVDVHLGWMVLRRTFGDRDGAGDPVRG